MAKPTAPAPAPASKSPDHEVPTVLLRRIAPGRFEVVAGVVRGVFVPTKKLESSVSYVVGHGAAMKELRKLAAQAEARLPLAAEPGRKVGV